MPEGLTYWDMARMLKAQIPPGFYRLELNEQFIGKGKFVGEEMLEPYLHSELEFHFQPQEMIKTWGKAMGLSINGGLWLRLQFALHGHTVAMSREEYESCKKVWSTPTKDNITIQLAVVGSEMCIVFVDKNRLIQITCVALYPTVVPMPTATLLDFFTLPAFSSSSSTAIPMPTTKTSTVFKCEILQKRLVEAIKDFFAQAHSPDYQKRIPANKTPTRAFEFAKSTTRYYHSQVTKVYRKKDTLIPYTLYQTLWEAGLLDRKICQQLPEDWKDDERTTTDTGRKKKKKVPVYILEFRSGVMSARHRTVQEEELEEVDDYMVTESENGSGSGSGNGGAGQKRKKKEKQKGRRRYAYTIIFKQPEGAKARIMTTEEGIKAHKFLDPEKERADIGPVSFNDTVKEGKDREAEVNKFCKKLPIRSGRLGRPVVRKKSKLEM
ncbi:hypothetical protein HOY82DRAFT_666825 [Tuber indicum]|nr:hypothetical protein HOY82DRAFT_666825 [Tuber indicum]